MSEGNYTIQAKPINNKNWNNCDTLEISLELERQTEKVIFKGLIGIYAIIKQTI